MVQKLSDIHELDDIESFQKSTIKNPIMKNLSTAPQQPRENDSYKEQSFGVVIWRSKSTSSRISDSR